MSVLAIIPARGGSRGVPRKNIALLGGKPLIQYTIDAARAVGKRLDSVVVSTEDREIARIAKDLGASVPFLRPPELATDHARTIDVVRDVVARVESGGSPFDWVLLLQPTTPFRSPADILTALDLANEGGCDSVISVVRVEDAHPARMKRIVDGRLEPFCVEEIEGTRRQDLAPHAYLRNGAIYLARRDLVVETDSMWGSHIRPYVMPAERSVNIDKPIDLLVAQALLGEGDMDRPRS